MKLKYVWAWWTMITLTTCFSQETVKKEEKEEVTISEDRYSELKKKARELDSIHNKEDSQLVGYLKAYDFDITLRYYIGSGITVKTAAEISIDSISILVKDGYILDINVYAKGRQFTNRNATIGLTTRRFSGTDRFYNVFNDREFIVLRDFMQIIPRNSFIPDDFFAVLTREKNNIPLKRNVGINTVLDLRFYSDALALFGNEANGIVQFDGNFKQIIHRYNYPNAGIFTPAQYVKINFNASKFDSENKYVYTDNFSASNLLQRSHFSMEGAVNVVSGWIINKSLSTFFGDFGIGVNSATMVSNDIEETITFSNMFLEGGVKLKSSDNIGGDFSCRLSKFFSPQTEDLNQETPTAYFNFIRIRAEIYWSPFKEKASRLFARANYTTSTNSYDKSNHFYQIQVGYSLLISDLIKK